MTVQSDVVDGTGLSDGPDGFTATRAFIVSEITGSAAGIVYAAANSPGVPQRGEGHPAVPFLRCESRTFDTLDSTTVKVVCNYKPFSQTNTPELGDPPKLSIGSSITSQETNLDVNGELLLVSLKISETVDGQETERDVNYYGTLNVNVPQNVFRYTRREEVSPADKARYFVGTMNSAIFQGDPARYWLCTRIEGQSSDGGQTWVVDYEFQRNNNTWDGTVLAIDSETRNPPLPEQVGNQEITKTFQMYPETDFGQLGLV